MREDNDSRNGIKDLGEFHLCVTVKGGLLKQESPADDSSNGQKCRKNRNYWW